jgi:hypothetical protein
VCACYIIGPHVFYYELLPALYYMFFCDLSQAKYNVVFVLGFQEANLERSDYSLSLEQSGLPFTLFFFL